MVKIDIHVHTMASSCSNLSAQDLARMAIEWKLPVVVMTNHHDSYSDAEFLRQKLEPNGIRFFPGIEITNNWGDFLLFGEDLSKFQRYTKKFPTNLLPADDIAVIWAHPYRFYSVEEIDSIKHKVAPYIDAIEGINGNCIRSKPECNQRAIQLARELKKPVTGGSDAHIYHSFFKCYTIFHTPIESYSDFVKAIKDGKVEPGTSPCF